MKNVMNSCVFFIFATTLGGCIEEIARQEPGESIGSPEFEPEGGSNPEAAVPEPGEDPLIGPVEGNKTVLVKITTNEEGDVYIDKTNAGCHVHQNLSCTRELTLGEHEIRIWGPDGYIQADSWYECLDDVCWEGKYHDLTLFTITEETTELFIPLYRDLTGTWIRQDGHIFDVTMWFDDPENDEEHSCPTTWARVSFDPGSVCVEHDGTLSFCKDRSKSCIDAYGTVIEEGSIFEEGSKLKVSITFLWQSEDDKGNPVETPQTIVYERWEN